jgi:hypothetical protein
VFHAGTKRDESGRLLAEEIDRRPTRYPALQSLQGLLFFERTLETEIERTVDADGAVLDTASPELKRIRDALRRAHSRIVRKLEEYVRTLPERYVVADACTNRNGCYVIAIGARKVGRRRGGGRSTGATLFGEPPLIELMNELGIERGSAQIAHPEELTRRVSRPELLGGSGGARRLTRYAARLVLSGAETPEVLDAGAGRCGRGQAISAAPRQEVVLQPGLEPASAR